jgi:hypothetical protein
VASRRVTILQLIASFELVEIDTIVLERAAQPVPTALGTLDAIHLATTVLWKDMTREDLVMATHDGALALGEAHGLPVIRATPCWSGVCRGEGVARRLVARLSPHRAGQGCAECIATGG